MSNILTSDPPVLLGQFQHWLDACMCAFVWCSQVAARELPTTICHADVYDDIFPTGSASYFHFRLPTRATCRGWNSCRSNSWLRSSLPRQRTSAAMYLRRRRSKSLVDWSSVAGVRKFIQSISSFKVILITSALLTRIRHFLCLSLVVSPRNCSLVVVYTTGFVVLWWLMHCCRVPPFARPIPSVN